MTGTEPTRERVEAYEKGLGCERHCERYVEHPWCFEHGGFWTDLGCPVAVAAARVEAERVAEVERQRDAAQARTVRANDDRDQAWRIAAQRRDEGRAQYLRAEAAESELASLRAVVKQVRAIIPTIGSRGIQDALRAALLPEATP